MLPVAARSATDTQPSGRNAARARTVALLAVLLSPGWATGAPAPRPVACPPGNVLEGLAPAAVFSVLRAHRVNDGKLPAEGMAWADPAAAVFQADDASVEYDLGRIVRLSTLFIQADGDDVYTISLSLDGRRFRRYWRAEALPPGPARVGLRSRALPRATAVGRYLRVTASGGDGRYSVGEVQAFCRRPKPFPPRIERVGSAASPAPAPAAWSREQRLSAKKAVLGLFGVLALAGLLWPSVGPRRRRWRVLGFGASALMAATSAYFVAGAWAALGSLLAGAALAWGGLRRRPLISGRLLERASLLSVVVASVLCFTNFLTWHGVRQVHLWDTLHYYMGAKYFPETGYRLLYACAAEAEIEDGRNDEVWRRRYRDLSSNRLTTVGAILPQLKACRERFSPARWRAFRADLRRFRALMGPSWFAGAFEDHGYNASPVWTALGRPIANWGWDADRSPDSGDTQPGQPPISAVERAAAERNFQSDVAVFYDRLKRLVRIDLALYATLLALLGWAFGLPAATLAALFWGVGHPWAYYWTGGSFLRVPYLALSVGGLCLIKKSRPAAGAFAIAWAGLLRLFPAALAGGVLLKILSQARHGGLSRVHVRLIGGALAAVLILGGVSLLAPGPPNVYEAFYTNTLKHRATPLTNHMGLPTLLSYAPEASAAHLRDERLMEPYSKWKEARVRLLAGRRPLWWALVAGLIVTMFFVAARVSDWEATAWSATFVVCLVQLTGYYYALLVLLAPIAIRRRSSMVAFALASILTQVAAFWVTFTDTLHVIDSAVMVGLVLGLLTARVLELRGAPRRCLQCDARPPST